MLVGELVRLGLCELRSMVLSERLRRAERGVCEAIPALRFPRLKPEFTGFAPLGQGAT